MQPQLWSVSGSTPRYWAACFNENITIGSAFIKPSKILDKKSFQELQKILVEKKLMHEAQEQSIEELALVNKITLVCDCTHKNPFKISLLKESSALGKQVYKFLSNSKS